MTRGWIGFAAVVCLAATAAADSPLDRFEGYGEALDRADSLLAVDAAADAVALLRPLLEAVETDRRALWPLNQRLGLALLRLGRHEEALPHFEQAVLWNQADPVNHRNLAALLLRMGRRGRAFSEYRDAVSLAPDSWELRVEFAHVLLDYDQLERAGSMIREAETLCADCPRVLQAASRLHLMRRDYVAARPYLESLHMTESHPEISLQLALALLRTGDAERARALLLPSWPHGLDGTGVRVVLEADRVLGDGTRARSLTGDLQDDSVTEDAEVWALGALICHDLGDDEQGLALIDRAIVLAPRNAAFRNNRVAFLLRLGRDDEADAEWALVLELDPSLERNRTETPAD